MDDDSFDKIFRTESVFKDQKSLAQAWQPKKGQKLICRDNEIKKLTVIHRPIIDDEGEFSVNTLVLGNGGIGKTLTVRYFGARFQDAAIKRGVKITVEYYDCLQHRSKSSILRNISERLHYNAGHGYSDNEIMMQIMRQLKKRKEFLLIILDEAHHLPAGDILALLNSSIGFGEKNSRFSMICISRPTDWYRVENEKITSRIQDTLKMKYYSREEAIKILKYRRNIAFREGVIEDNILELIGDIVVDAHNMRSGIDIMRSCGIRANELGLSNIESDMVLQSRNDINPTFKATIIDQLKEHEKISLLAIARELKQSGDPSTMVDPTYEMYCMICEEKEIGPHVKMSFRKYIRNLNQSKAVETDYMNPTADKKGRQLVIKLIDIDPEKLIELLEEIVH
jgi:archaeal cell division control protein 6